MIKGSAFEFSLVIRTELRGTLASFLSCGTFDLREIMRPRVRRFWRLLGLMLVVAI